MMDEMERHVSMSLNSRTKALLVLVFFVLRPSSFVLSEEVHWHTDYAAARRAAQEADRPLLLAFGSEDCEACKKLDLTTLSDSAVITVINERLIPLKVDARRDAPLKAALGIDTLPTLILAAPDGKLLAKVPGYLDVARCHEWLLHVLTVWSNPEWMLRDYEAATKAVADAEYARAVALLHELLEDGQSRPVQALARRMLQALEAEAAGRVARVRQLDAQGQTAEAITLLLATLRAFAGTKTADDAGKLLVVLAAKPVARPTAQAKAQQVVIQARADEPAPQPEQLRQACDRLSERLGKRFLELAEAYLNQNEPEQAVRCYQWIVSALPASDAAATARQRLAR